MKIRIDQSIATFTMSTVLLLSACKGELAVVDDLRPRDVEAADGQGSVLAPDAGLAPGARCSCASSASLQALACYDGRPFTQSQTTTDGSVVAFNVATPEGAPWPVFYWASNAPTSNIASGSLAGMSASGEALVDSQTEAGVWRIGPEGRTGQARMRLLAGRGLLSEDGNIAVGAIADGDATGLARANMNTGEIEVLGHLRSDRAVLMVNPDASTIVGSLEGILPTGEVSSADEDWAAFRWNEQGLSLGLPGVPANKRPHPQSLSADGSVISGVSSNNATFRWSEADGYVEVASQAGSANKLSADGSVLLASSQDPQGVESVFRWTNATGAVELAPGTNTRGGDMSADGRVIATTSWRGQEPKDPLVWDTEHGTRSLDEILHARGIDTSGWNFSEAQQLSADGKVLIGQATCGGVFALYRAVLSED